jgi:Fis family transcriptional regulator
MSKQLIEASVRESLEEYFRDLDGAQPHSVHEMIIAIVEKPLLEVVMQHAAGNQSKAAEWLGINRNTLRRKLLEHKLLGSPSSPSSSSPN